MSSRGAWRIRGDEKAAHGGDGGGAAHGDADAVGGLGDGLGGGEGAGGGGERGGGEAGGGKGAVAGLRAALAESERLATATGATTARVAEQETADILRRRRGGARGGTRRVSDSAEMRFGRGGWDGGRRRSRCYVTRLEITATTIFATPRRDRKVGTAWTRRRSISNARLRNVLDCVGSGARTLSSSATGEGARRSDPFARRAHATGGGKKMDRPMRSEHSPEISARKIPRASFFTSKRRSGLIRNVTLILSPSKRPW